MATRFRTTFTNFDGAEFEIVIDDKTYAGDIVDYIAAGEGFELSYETSGGALLVEALMASTVSLFMHVRPEYQSDFDDFVEDLVDSGDENRFTVIIEKNAGLYWRGKLLPERIGIPDRNFTEATLIASDGLGRLQSLPYDDSGTLYEGWETYKGHLYNILSKLDLFDFPDTADSIVIMQNWRVASETSRLLENTRVQHDSFKEIKSDGTILPVSCFDVLIQILTRLNLRITQWGGAYYLQQFGYLAETGNKTFDRYDSDGDFVASSSASFNTDLLIKLAGGQTWFREAAQSVVCQYSYRDSLDGSNLFTGLIPQASTVQLGFIPAGNGEVLGFGFDFKVVHTGNPMSLLAFSIQYIFTIRSGTYYLRNDNNVWEWTTDSANRVKIISAYEIEDFHNINIIQDIGFICPELPESGDVSILWTYARTDSEGTPVSPVGTTVINVVRNAAQIIYAIGDATEGTIVTTASFGNATGEMIELPALVNGDLPFLRSIGRIQYYDSTETEWINSEDFWGFGSNESLWIDELLTREVATLQKKVTRIIGYNLRSDVQAITKLAGAIITRAIYQANASQWQVECFVPQTDKTGVTWSDYTETDQTGGLPNGITPTPQPPVAQLWKRDSGVLSPTTDGDVVEIILDNDEVTALTVRNDSGVGVSVYTEDADAFTSSSLNQRGAVIQSANNIAFFASIAPTLTNTIEDIFEMWRTCTGSPDNNIGGAMLFKLERKTDNNVVDSMRLATQFINAASGSETSDFIIQLRNAGAALAEKLRLTGAGELITSKLSLGTTVAPTSTIQVSGSHGNSLLIQTSATLNVNETMYQIVCDTTSNAITVNLPTAVGIDGRTYLIRRWKGTNNVVIDPNSTENVLGSVSSYLTLTLANNGEWVEIVSDGTDWVITRDNPTF
jgi:hypothetical protein